MTCRLSVIPPDTALLRQLSAMLLCRQYTADCQSISAFVRLSLFGRFIRVFITRTTTSSLCPQTRATLQKDFFQTVMLQQYHVSALRGSDMIILVHSVACDMTT